METKATRQQFDEAMEILGEKWGIRRDVEEGVSERYSTWLGWRSTTIK